MSGEKMRPGKLSRGLAWGAALLLSWLLTATILIAVFMQALTQCGVFARTPDGQKGFLEFLASVHGEINAE